jgi:hypothetical protein
MLWRNDRQSMRTEHDVNPQRGGSLLQGLQTCLSLPKGLKSLSRPSAIAAAATFFARVVPGDTPYPTCFLSTSCRRLLYGVKFSDDPQGQSRPQSGYSEHSRDMVAEACNTVRQD